MKPRKSKGARDCFGGMALAGDVVGVMALAGDGVGVGRKGESSVLVAASGEHTGGSIGAASVLMALSRARSAEAASGVAASNGIGAGRDETARGCGCVV